MGAPIHVSDIPRAVRWPATVCGGASSALRAPQTAPRQGRATFALDEHAPLWPQDARACRHIAGVKRELQARPDERRTSGVHCRRRQAPACHPLPDDTVAEVARHRPSLHRAPTAAACVKQPQTRDAACACSMHMAHARPAVGRGGRQSACPRPLSALSSRSRSSNCGRS